MKLGNYCLTLLVLVLVTSASFATEVSLIDNNAWTYYLSDNDVQNGAVLGSHSLVSDYGNSLQVVVSGAPSALHAYQPILAPIYTGDVVTMTVAHSDLGNFSGMHFAIGTGSQWFSELQVLYDNEQSRGSEPVNQLYSVTWTADANYAAGTSIYYAAAAWPGEATYWIKDVTVPEPATMSLLGLGLAGLIARRKRK